MIVFATDDERDDDELTVEAKSLKQNVPFLRSSKKGFILLFHPQRRLKQKLRLMKHQLI